MVGVATYRKWHLPLNLDRSFRQGHFSIDDGAMKDYATLPPHAVRRKDRKVEDERWIREMLRTAPFGVMATAHEGQPFVNSNLFAYDEREHCLYMHTSHAGRTSANVSADERVCFTAFEMGRLLPAPRAFNLSVEYAGVVVFGRARVLASETDKRHGLDLLARKYFTHLRPGDDYEAPSGEELSLTSVYRIDIEAWSGKRKAVEPDYAGGFTYGGGGGEAWTSAARSDGGRSMRTGITYDRRVLELGLELPAWREPAGSYLHAVVTGNILYSAGHVPWRPDGTLIRGRLGEDLSVEEGVEAARVCALNLLSTIKHELGSLDRVGRVVRLLATINATPDFMQHTTVANGASDLLIEVFGEAGRHARLAVGVSSLPANIALEIEAMIELT